MNLVLASSSPRRLELLKQIGLAPMRVVATDGDETPLKNELPRALALRLSVMKVNLVAPLQDEVILAADTVVALGRRILPKAETREEVEACLKQLSGRAHRVYTGVSVRSNSKILTRVVETRLHFKRLSEDEIKTYLESGEGLGKAGGYAIQGRAAAFVIKQQGSYTNVVGLPLYEVSGLLKQFEIEAQSLNSNIQNDFDIWNSKK